MMSGLRLLLAALIVILSPGPGSTLALAGQWRSAASRGSVPSGRGSASARPVRPSLPPGSPAGAVLPMPAARAGDSRPLGPALPAQRMEPLASLALPAASQAGPSAPRLGPSALGRDLAQELSQASGLGPEAASRLGGRILDGSQGPALASFGEAVPAGSAGAGRSGLWRPRPAYPGDEALKARALTDTTFVVFDLETTSAFPEVGHPYQVGAVKLRLKEDGSIDILGSFEKLAQSPTPIPAAFSEFTAITNGDLAGAPSLRQVLREFREFAGEDSVWLAHNAPFDVSFSGYRLREAGLALAPHLVLDTKDLVKSLFPQIQIRSLANLIALWKLGGYEEHQGLSDAVYAARVMAHAVKRLAEQAGKPVSGLTLGDLAGHSANLHFDAVLADLEPAASEPAQARPVPPDFEAEVERIDRGRHRQGLPTRLGDIARQMGVGYQDLLAKMREALARAQVSPADSIIAEILANPPEAVVVDYDQTLTDRGPDGLSLPPPAAIIDSLNRLLEAGIPVVVVTGRTFRYQPPEARHPDHGYAIPYEIESVLVSRIRADLRPRLLVVSSMGGEFVGFTRAGKPEFYHTNGWDSLEKSKIEASLREAMSRAGLAKHEVTLIDTIPNQGAVILRKGEQERAAAFAKALQEEFSARRLFHEVVHDDLWVYFSKHEKGRDASRPAYIALRVLKHPVLPNNLLFIGDQFQVPADLPPGGDASMARPFPESPGISVGGKPGDPLPPNVRRLGIKGSRGTYRVLKAVLDGHARKKKGLDFKPETLKLAGAFLMGAGLAAAFLQAGAAALIGTLLLTAIGIPQIVKNFREGRRATQDLPLSWALLWFSAAAFLTVSSFLDGSNVLYLIANLLGTLQSLIMTAQINYYNRAPGELRTTLIVLGLVLLPIALTYLGVGLAAPVWASGLFAAAMALLVVINIPQIRRNYRLYQHENRLPEGLSPLYPFLLLSGSFFHLIAAFSAGNLRWIANSLTALAAAVIVLGQILLPYKTNGFLAALASLPKRLFRRA